MAKIIGTGGAWGSIQAMLETVNLQAGQPGEVHTLLQEHKTLLEKSLVEARAEIEGKIAPFAEEIAREKENIERGPAERLGQLESEIQQTELALELYRLEKGLFSRIRNLFRIGRVERKLARLSKEREKISERVKRLLEEQDLRLTEKRASLEAEVMQQYQDLQNKVNILQQAENSKELADAVTELEMLEILRGLPEQVTVLNNVVLEADRGFRLDGKWIQTARIDHLVLTPSGLFSLALYQASRQPNTNHDTADEVRQSAAICYDLLRDKFPQATVRGILAYRNHAPEKASPFVKTLPFTEVNGYINWFKDSTLSPERIEEIVAYLKELA